MDDREHTVVALLERLAPDVDEASDWARISARVARERRRRRVLAGAAAVAVLLGGAAVVLAIDDGDTGGQPMLDVVTDPTDTSVPTTEPTTADPTTPATTPPTTEPSTATMVAEPRTDLEDGQDVELVLDPDPGGELTARQCAVEAIGAGDPNLWCDAARFPLRSSAGRPDLSFRALRAIDTQQLGIIDCAANPDRCAIVVWATPDTSQATPYVAPISFRPDLAPLPVPTLVATPGEVGDGETTTIVGTGFRADEEVRLAQCRSDGTDDSCDMARTLRITPDADGSFTVAWIASSDVLLYDGWHPCDPCSLQALAIRIGSVSIPFTVVADESPTRPAVEILEVGPYEWGQRVTLVGSGFQANADNVQIGWCRFDSPTSWDDCTYPPEGFGATVDDNGQIATTPLIDAAGSLTITGYPMPGDTWSASPACTGTGTDCGLAWKPGTGAPYAFTVPFSLTSR
jgi:hypothetical protein